MTCPRCGSDNVRVLETIPGYESKVYRRRKCVQCDTKFKTIEDILPDDSTSQNDYRSAVIKRSSLLRSIYK